MFLIRYSIRVSNFIILIMSTISRGDKQIMNIFLKKNVKFLNQKTNISKILGINEQSLKNKIYDEKRNFSINDLIKISTYLNISIEDLLYKDLSKEDKPE